MKLYALVMLALKLSVASISTSSTLLRGIINIIINIYIFFFSFHRLNIRSFYYFPFNYIGLPLAYRVNIADRIWVRVLLRHKVHKIHSLSRGIIGGTVGGPWGLTRLLPPKKEVVFYFKMELYLSSLICLFVLSRIHLLSSCYGSRIVQGWSPKVHNSFFNCGFKCNVRNIG